jgi:MFS family permease
MIFFRCLAGVFAGTVVTVRAMLTENSTKETQARVFSYFAFAGNLGIFAGPLLGMLPYSDITSLLVPNLAPCRWRV